MQIIKLFRSLSRPEWGNLHQRYVSNKCYLNTKKRLNKEKKEVTRYRDRVAIDGDEIIGTHLH